jgi:VWFA-related protein
MRRMTEWVVASAISAVLTPAAQSQQSQRTPPPFRSGVDVVQLDVSVLDANRHPVKGLTAADFTVTDNGVSQPIVAFENVDIPGAGALTAPWIRTAFADVVTNEPGTRRIVVIVLDDAFTGLDPWIMQTAKHIARDVVHRLGPADLAAVTFTEYGRRQDITSDRARLFAAIDSFVSHPAYRTPLGMTAAQGGGGSLRSEFPGSPYGSPCSFRGKLRSAAACVLDTFITAGEALKSAPQGRKTIVYISGGPPFDLSMSDLRGGTPPPGEEVLGIQKVLKSFHEANINVYAVDPSGVRGVVTDPQVDSLRMFSEETGGRETINTNTPWEAVPQIFLENSSYYMLGIRTSGKPDDRKFHRVHVTVDRPGVELRARNGYYPPTSDVASARSAPSTPLGDELNQAVPGGALPLALSVAPFAAPGGRAAAVAVLTRVLEPLSNVPQTLELATLALDSDCGECRPLPSARQRFDLPRGTPEGPRAEVQSRLDLPPGSYEIRVAATLDGRSGGVFTHVDVPDFRKDRLSASGMVLTTDAPTLQRSGAALIPVQPTALREFRPGATVAAFLRLYQAASKPLGSVRVNATILDEAGRTNSDETTFLEAAAFKADHSKDYRMTLPTSSLASGQHLLTIEAHLGDRAIRRQATFTIR